MKFWALILMVSVSCQGQLLSPRESDSQGNNQPMLKAPNLKPPQLRALPIPDVRDVSFSWMDSTNANFYTLYWGTNQGQYQWFTNVPVPLVTIQIGTNVDDVYAAATVTDKIGMTSDYSNEARLTGWQPNAIKLDWASGKRLDILAGSDIGNFNSWRMFRPQVVPPVIIPIQNIPEQYFRLRGSSEMILTNDFPQWLWNTNYFPPHYGA